MQAKTGTKETENMHDEPTPEKKIEEKQATEEESNTAKKTKPLQRLRQTKYCQHRRGTVLYQNGGGGQKPKTNKTNKNNQAKTASTA